jgi:hypothetical protein
MRAVLRLVSCALLLLLMVPQTAAAASEPLKLTPRMVVGDTRHYISAVRMTMTIPKQQPVSVDINMGTEMEVEELLDDGSARVRGTIQSADLGDNSAFNFDASQYVGQSYISVIHPDGSTTVVFDAENGGSRLVGSGATPPLFPPAGLEVGQSFDASTPFPALFTGLDAPSVAVHTTLDGVVDEGGQQTARMVQTMSVKGAELAFGPFGASGTATLDGDSYQVARLALDTGWPIAEDGVVAYNVDVTSEKQEQAVGIRLETHMAMDDEALAEN